MVFTLGDHTARICLWEKVKNDQLSVVRSPVLLAKLRWVYLKFIWFSMLLLTNVKNKPNIRIGIIIFYQYWGWNLRLTCARQVPNNPSLFVF